MAAPQPRIKLHFEGMLGQQLVEHNLQKCWYQLPAVTKKSSSLQTVADLITKLQEAFDLLGEQSDLQLELDGYTVLSNTPLSLFRDGDTVIIKSQKRPLSLPNGIHTEGDEQKFPEPAVALTAADDQHTEVSRPKKRKKAAAAAATAAATAADSSHNAGMAAVDTSQAGTEPANVTAPASTTKKRKKKKRKRGQSQSPEADQAQSADGHSAEAAGDALGAAGDAPVSTEEKEKTQSRSARRKQLKRRYRRSGLAPPPPQAPASSSQPSASVNPALAAAAEASPFDPNGAQPHQGTLAHPVSDSPPTKRLKTQSVASAEPPKTQPLKTQSLKAQLREQLANEGRAHVHFAGSGSDLDSDDVDDEDDRSLPPAPIRTHDKPGTSQQTSAFVQASLQVRQANGFQSTGLQQDPSHQALSTQKAASASEGDGAGSSMPLPASDAEHAALPAIRGYPLQGDIVAYKLLEIGADWAPEVSEWRHGEVGESELAGLVVIKPLAGQGSQAQPSAEGDGHVEHEEEEEEEGPPSNYDEEGVLTTELTSLSELRLIRPSPHAINPPAAPPTASPPASAGSEPPRKAVLQETLDVASDIGKVAEAAASASPFKAAEMAITAAAAAQSENTVPMVGAWAELSDEIARRKNELASKASSTGPGTLSGSDKAAANGVHEGSQEKQQQQPGLEAKSVAGMNTPGAVRPRGGVRASAMGPMLAFLRSSGGLQGSS